MQHLLDNPVFNALISGNSQMANGNKEARFFDKEVSPLIGLREYTPETFKQLYELITEDRTLATVTAFDIDIPAPWKLVNNIKILQMVFEGQLPGGGITEEPVTLQKEHVPAMLALTKLTNPGPFAERTIEFGNYEGIFKDGALAAMAGFRMQPSPYTEVSAVCTHPDHHGKGYAGQMVRRKTQQILDAGAKPFLHVRNDNFAAIRLYQKLGFVIRTEINFNVIRKDK